MRNTYGMNNPAYGLTLFCGSEHETVRRVADFAPGTVCWPSPNSSRVRRGLWIPSLNWMRQLVGIESNRNDRRVSAFGWGSDVPGGSDQYSHDGEDAGSSQMQRHFRIVITSRRSARPRAKQSVLVEVEAARILVLTEIHGVTHGNPKDRNVIEHDIRYVPIGIYPRNRGQMMYPCPRRPMCLACRIGGTTPTSVGCEHLHSAMDILDTATGYRSKL